MTATKWYVVRTNPDGTKTVLSAHATRAQAAYMARSHTLGNRVSGRTYAVSTSKPR